MLERVNPVDRERNAPMENASSSCSVPDKAILERLKLKLTSGIVDQERAGAQEFRKLAKMNSVNRLCLAEVGAIPLLVQSLTSKDVETQTHAVTALLNLTLRNDSNKQAVVATRRVDFIVELLRKGSLEARENAAALLFNLSRVEALRDDVCGVVGVFDGIVSLLLEGSYRGKKDALAALYNCVQVNWSCALAVRAGAVEPLLQIAKNPNSCLVDESLWVLLSLASHQEGRFAISQLPRMQVLVELIQRGSSSNKELACCVLLVLCQHDFLCSDSARALGVRELLTHLSLCGSERARRKASQVLSFL